MLKELTAGKKVSGIKQSRRAIRDGRARTVFIARDADPAVTGPLRNDCGEHHIPVVEEFSMRELGQAAGIQVGTAAAVLLKG